GRNSRDTRKRTRSSNLSSQHAVSEGRADLARNTDVYGGCDAMVEHDLAIEPLIAHHCVPQPRQDEFPTRVYDIGVARIPRLSHARDIRDAISFDDDYGIGYRWAPVAVYQCSAFNDERRLLRLNGSYGRQR